LVFRPGLIALAGFLCPAGGVSRFVFSGLAGRAAGGIFRGWGRGFAVLAAAAAKAPAPAAPAALTLAALGAFWRVLAGRSGWRLLFRLALLPWLAFLSRLTAAGRIASGVALLIALAAFVSAALLAAPRVLVPAPGFAFLARFAALAAFGPARRRAGWWAAFRRRPALGVCGLSVVWTASSAGHMSYTFLN
jgi:hypothetical protein